jgi:hypothetical protein
MFGEMNGGEMSVRSAPWLSLAHSGLAPLTTQQMGTIIDELSAYFHAERFVEVDQALTGADPEFMSTDAVVTISRTSYPARDRLQNWNRFVGRATSELAKRGEEAAMMGLA